MFVNNCYRARDIVYIYIKIIVNWIKENKSEMMIFYKEHTNHQHKYKMLKKKYDEGRFYNIYISMLMGDIYNCQIWVEIFPKFILSY